MVSILLGLPGILAVIEQRILACVPTTFATDTFVKADRAQREGQNNLLIDYWRQFGVEVSDSDPSAFQGNYAYQNRTLQLNVLLWYSRAGAARVTGNPDVDFQALAFQDAHDIQRALQGPITTADGSTARVIYQNVNVSQDDVGAEVAISFELPCFLRGTAQVPALYLGPSQQHALDGGSKFYLVAQSDLACSGVLASSPAGCTHDTALDLGSGTPQVIEVTCTTAGTYTFTLSGNGGSDTCEVQVYATTMPISFNLPVFSKNPGLVELTYPEGITGPATVIIEGERVWRNGLKNGEYLAIPNVLQNRDNITICIEYDDRKMSIPNPDATVEVSYAIMLRNHRIDAVQRVNWSIGVWMFRLGTSAITTRPMYWQSQNQSAAQVASVCTANPNYTTSGIKRVLVFLSGDKTYWCNNTGTGTAYDQTVARNNPSGTMGGTEVLSIHRDCKASIFPGEMSQAQREAFMQLGTFPTGATAQWLGGHEIDPSAPVFWDTAGTYDLYKYDMVYTGSYAASASGDFTDSQTVVPWATVPCVATESGTKTITARRARQGVPARASEAERYQTTTATYVNGQITVPIVFND